MACRTGCPTKDCESFAACLRGSGIRVAYCNSAGNYDYTAQKKWDAELDYYRDTVRQGIQPDGTTREKIDAAVAMSDVTGTAYRADA